MKNPSAVIRKFNGHITDRSYTSSLDEATIRFNRLSNEAGDCYILVDGSVIGKTIIAESHN